MAVVLLRLQRRHAREAAEHDEARAVRDDRPSPRAAGCRRAPRCPATCARPVREDQAAAAARCARGSRRGQRVGRRSAQLGQLGAMRGSSAGSLRIVAPGRPLRRRCDRATAAGCRARRSPCTIGSSGTRCGDAADPQRPVEGQRAAEAELEAELDEGLGLLLAAVEGMGDAARHRRRAQLLRARCRPRGATCSSTGSVELARRAAAAPRRSAPGARGRGPATKWSRPISPTATSRGSSRWRASASRRRRQVGVAGRVGAHRMDAERIGQAVRGAPARAPRSKLPTSTAGRTIWPRRRPAPARRRRRDRRRTRRVEVAMRVDPHGRR